MTNAAGACIAGGFQEIAVDEGGQKYAFQFLPDLHNDLLQREGKPPVYYWVPKAIRIARKGGDTGDYKFSLLHFVGIQSEDTTVGVAGERDTTGGVFGVTITSAPPESILLKAQQDLINKFAKNSTNKYWRYNSTIQPDFRPIEIRSNITSMTNLAPGSNGVPPVATVNINMGHSDSSNSKTLKSSNKSNLRVQLAKIPNHVRLDKPSLAPSTLDAWYWNLQGQGQGSIDPFGENAYSGLIGTLPAALLWQCFHGTYSPIAVFQKLLIPVWAETYKITITGNWKKCFEHFSAHAKASGWWFSADIKVEMNNLMINGGIDVKLEIDGTFPNADKMREEANKRIDLVYNKFMDAAQKVIFEPAPPEVKPAEASSNTFFGWGGGFALKWRKDETTMNLNFNMETHERFNLETTISSTLEGFYEEIKKDPEAEKKYFTTLYLDDWDRKIVRNIKPVVNWPVPGQFIGEPVAFVDVQIGYPDTEGSPSWTGHIFQSTDTGPTTCWSPAFAKKKLSDVNNPPSEWTPDKTFVKRTIHFTEPPSEIQYPFSRQYVEKNIVELDPGENGRLLNDINLEIRADSAGKLDVGPITLNVDLQTAQQVIEVTFQADGKMESGNERPKTRVLWTFADNGTPAYWQIFTGQLDYFPKFKYQVRVIVKGSIFEHGREWTGPWNEVSGNGPLMISVPAPGDPGVIERDLSPEGKLLVTAVQKGVNISGFDDFRNTSKSSLNGPMSMAEMLENRDENKIKVEEELIQGFNTKYIPKKIPSNSFAKPKQIKDKLTQTNEEGIVLVSGFYHPE